MLDDPLVLDDNGSPAMHDAGAGSRPSYRPVHAVQRALTLLCALNTRGVSSIDALYRSTGLPKPTIVRLMETLIAEGYVTKDKKQGGYLVTSLVQSLSCGFHADPLVVQAGRPWASALTRRLQWPISIALLDESDVVIRFSTVSDSPVSPAHATINMRLSLLDRAMGLSYLAFCPEGEREILLHILETSRAKDLAAAGGRRSIEDRLQLIRKDGYSTRGKRVEPLSSGTVAVPIMDDGRVLATMGMGYFRSAVTEERIAQHYVPIMQESAAHIVEQVRLLRRGDGSRQVA